MSITGQNILDFLNYALTRNETLVGVTPQIRAAAKAVAIDFACLETEATPTALAASGYQIDYPADFAVLRNLYVYESGDNDIYPLKKHQGAWPTSATNGTPQTYRHYNRKFEVTPPAGGAYSVKVEYGREHPDSIATILIPDTYREALYRKATELVAWRYGGLGGAGKLWYGLYGDEKERLQGLEPVEIENIEYQDL